MTTRSSGTEPEPTSGIVVAVHTFATGLAAYATAFVAYAATVATVGAVRSWPRGRGLDMAAEAAVAAISGVFPAVLLWVVAIPVRIGLDRAPAPVRVVVLAIVMVPAAAVASVTLTLWGLDLVNAATPFVGAFVLFAVAYGVRAMRR